MQAEQANSTQITATDDDDDLTCPITLDLFHDPVIAEDGRTYEREAIVKWLSINGTSPHTRQLLNANGLQPDIDKKRRADLRRDPTVLFNATTETVTLPPSLTAPIPIREPLAPVRPRYEPRTRPSQLLRGHSGRVAPERISHTSQPRACITDCADKYLSHCVRGFCCCLIISSVLAPTVVLTVLGNLPTPATTAGYINYYSLKAIYFGSLSNNSSIFIRPGTTNMYCYYQVIRFTINNNDYYKIKSESNIDMYGYLYFQSFNATSPYTNYRYQDNNSGGSGQFSILAFLSRGNYTLVATTYASYVIGNFSIIAAGRTNSMTFI